MKKTFLIYAAAMFIVFVGCFVFTVWGILYAQGMADTFKDAASTVTTTVTTGAPATQKRKLCRNYADTPTAEVDRADWEIEFRMNFLESPSNGGYQFHYQNIDARLVHNLSHTLYAYAWVGHKVIEKIDYEGAKYDKEWEVDMLFGGFGLYLTPVLKIFGGGGLMWTKNDGGEPSLDTPVERGIGYDWYVGDNGNKIVFEYRFIDAKLKDDPAVEEAPGDQSFSAVSFSYSVPL